LAVGVANLERWHDVLDQVQLSADEFVGYAVLGAFTLML
jgi:hypothetical protein